MATESPRRTNRLAAESSPYLRQHAHNPVDWYPWGSEAFDKASSENKPVFLSIGYSTCHWCHVMEGESFDDDEVATFLNEHFVSIKLDREQRPDLDDIYMTGVQMLTGQGGWPMSNFLTPEGKPFFAGTYYPKADFLKLLSQIVDVWRSRRADVIRQAEEIAAGIARFAAARVDAQAIPDALLSRASEQLLGRFDDVNGGFGGAPKFPNESSLLLLVEDWKRNGNRQAGRALALTLDKMRAGGIYDQICGGFHRYTVDAIWLVPHFEKMLYNQAQLVRLYARMAALTGNQDWRRVAEQTLGYVLRDMRDANGAFYSATDADSEGEEGLFFLWIPAELDRALDPADAALVTALYGVTANGNFEGRNILHLKQSLTDWAARHDMTEDALGEKLDAIHRRLYEVRERRVHPLRDEKIITAWNGMMITSLACAGFDLDRQDYLDAAVRAAEFLWRNSRQSDNALWRISFEGHNCIPANLEDYAYFAEALLTLFRYGAGDVWLTRGRLLVERMLADFRDPESGGFFLARDEADGPLITRPKSPMDGAVPSANSVALASLVALFEMTGDVNIEQAITETLGAFGGLLSASPSAFAYMITAVEQYRHGGMGGVQFAGSGNIRVTWCHTDRGGRLTLAIAEGWHINASEVSEGSLIPTRVDAGQARVKFPEPRDGTFKGRVAIEIEGEATAIDLTLQACSGDLCLAPQTLRFHLPAAGDQ